MKFKLDGSGEGLLQISVEGAITSTGLAESSDPFADVIGHAGYDRNFLMSLAGTDFIDSSGIGWLLATHKKIDSAGGTLVLHSLPPEVNNVFQMMKLDRVLRIAPTFDGAAEWFDPGKQENG